MQFKDYIKREELNEADNSAYYKSELEDPIMNADKYGCQLKVKSSDGESKWVTLNKESANILIGILKKKKW